MDRHSFDDLARRFGSARSRRAVLGVLGGLAVAGLGGRRARAQQGQLGPGERCASTQECSQAGGPLVCADNLVAEDGPLTCCRTESGACQQDSHCCGALTCEGGVCLGADGTTEPAATGGGLALGAVCTETAQCATVSGGVVVCGDNFISDDGPLNCCLEEGSACGASSECCGTVNCESGRCGAAAGAAAGDNGGDLGPGEFCVSSGQCTQALGPAICGDNALSGGATVCCLQEASSCGGDGECCGEAVCADNGIAADGNLNCCGYAGAPCGSDPGCCADLFCIAGACQPL